MGSTCRRLPASPNTSRPDCGRCKPHLHKAIFGLRCLTSGPSGGRSTAPAISLFLETPTGPRMIVVAIDIGGTFTDLIGFDAERNRFIEAKSLTTPAQLTRRHHRLHPQERDRCRRHRRADPRLDHRHQHADRAQGRAPASSSRAAPVTSTSSAAATVRRPIISSSTARPLVERRLIREAQERLLASGDVHETLHAASIEDACES